jgi:hypothetical protein
MLSDMPRFPRSRYPAIGQTVVRLPGLVTINRSLQTQPAAAAAPAPAATTPSGSWWGAMTIEGKLAIVAIVGTVAWLALRKPRRRR